LFHDTQPLWLRRTSTGGHILDAAESISRWGNFPRGATVSARETRTASNALDLNQATSSQRPSQTCARSALRKLRAEAPTTSSPAGLGRETALSGGHHRSTSSPCGAAPRETRRGPGREVRRGPKRGGERSPREGPRKATRRKTFPPSTQRSEPSGANLEPSSPIAPFSNSIFDLGGSRARVGAKRSQAGAKLKSANLRYEEPFSGEPPHLLNIILFKRWGDRERALARRLRPRLLEF